MNDKAYWTVWHDAYSGGISVFPQPGRPAGRTPLLSLLESHEQEQERLVVVVARNANRRRYITSNEALADIRADAKRVQQGLPSLRQLQAQSAANRVLAARGEVMVGSQIRTQKWLELHERPLRDQIQNAVRTSPPSPRESED